MATIQVKGNKNSNRNEYNKNSLVTRRKKSSSRRISEDTALGIRSERSSGSSSEEEERVRTRLSDTLEDSRSDTPRTQGGKNLNSNLNRQQSERRISRRDIVALLDEQRSFREELEDINKTNFNLEHLLSNCALKVENLNRKLLLVEYELSGINGTDFSNINTADYSNRDQPEMKWKESKEKREEKGKEGCAEEEEELPRSGPLRRSEEKWDLASPSPTFDNGRHKLEKYAKIHGIVKVEIEMYSSADDFETTTDNKESEELENFLEDFKTNSDSENTFSYGDKDKTNERNGGVLEKKAELRKEIVPSTSKPFRFSTRDELDGPKDTFKIDHNIHPNPVDDSSERSKSDSVHHQPSSAAVEYSLVDPDKDIFSQSIHSNDTLEQINIVFPAEDPPPSSRMAKTSSTVDMATVIPDAEQDLLAGWLDVGTTLLGEEDGLGGSWVDDVLRQYDRESSRERESLSETALSNGLDYRLETMSSSSFFSEGDDRVRHGEEPSSLEKRISDKNNGYSEPEMSRHESPDYDSVFSPNVDNDWPGPGEFDLSLEAGKISPDKPFMTPNSTRSSVAKKDSNSRRSSADHAKISESNSRRSSGDKKLSTSSSRRSSLENRISTPDSSRSSPVRRSSSPDSRRPTPDIRSFTPDVIPEETIADLPEADDNHETAKAKYSTSEVFNDPWLNSISSIDDLQKYAKKKEVVADEGEVKQQEDDALDALLADLEITVEDIHKSYNTPTIRIESGVEDGANLTLKRHRDDEIEPNSPSPFTSPMTETDGSESMSNFGLDRQNSRSHSIFDMEDSDEERRRKWRERPFPKRAARSFFARLCACWHH